MSTVRQLITTSLRIINYLGSGESATEDDMDISVQALDSMIDSWSNDPLMIYSLNPYKFATVAGQKEYTLGPTGDWDIPRPMQINQAYANWNDDTIQQVDLPVTILTDAQYAAISVKNTPTTFAFALYDDGNYPLRTISLWPVPTTNTPITLWLMQPLLGYTSIDDEVSYPPGYYEAFQYNLALRLAIQFGKTVPELVMSLAVTSKATIARLNAVPQYQSGDNGLCSNTQRSFNYITGNFVPWRP